MVNAYLLAALVFIGAMLLFILQNDAQVSIQFLSWKTSELSLAVVLIASVCAGALITFLLDSYRAFKTGQKMRKLVKENQKYEQEIRLLKGQVSAPEQTSGSSESVGRPPKGFEV